MFYSFQEESQMHRYYAFHREIFLECKASDAVFKLLTEEIHIYFI